MIFQVQEIFFDRWSFETQTSWWLQTTVCGVSIWICTAHLKTIAVCYMSYLKVKTRTIFDILWQFEIAFLTSHRDLDNQ